MIWEPTRTSGISKLQNQVEKGKKHKYYYLIDIFKPKKAKLQN